MNTQSPFDVMYNRDDVAFVGIGYNDACIDFLVRFPKYRFDQLEQAIKNVRYNAFNGVAVAKTFAKIKHLAESASFGREGSPVLYINLRREHEDSLGNYIEPGKGNPIGVDEVFTAFDTLRKSKPDEAMADFYDNALLRFWWD